MARTVSAEGPTRVAGEIQGKGLSAFDLITCGKRRSGLHNR